MVINFEHMMNGRRMATASGAILADAALLDADRLDAGRVGASPSVQSLFDPRFWARNGRLRRSPAGAAPPGSSITEVDSGCCVTIVAAGSWPGCRRTGTSGRANPASAPSSSIACSRTWRRGAAGARAGGGALSAARPLVSLRSDHRRIAGAASMSGVLAAARWLKAPGDASGRRSRGSMLRASTMPISMRTTFSSTAGARSASSISIAGGCAAPGAGARNLCAAAPIAR